MTRLITEWISGIEGEIKDYNDNLKKKIGMDLAKLAADSCGMTEAVFRDRLNKYTVAVVPITSGEGVIGAFSESVAAIIRVMGSNIFITETTDVSGMAEGIRKGADILFMADDHAYISVNVKTGMIGDNNTATARGFSTALERMAGTLINKEVLVIGCGIVGEKATAVLKEKGAAVSLYDKDNDKAQALKCEGVSVLADEKAIQDFAYFFDATNEGGWLHKEMLADNVMITTPGVPLSLDDDTYYAIQDRVIHDCLQIGTAVMLGLVL